MNLPSRNTSSATTKIQFPTKQLTVVSLLAVILIVWLGIQSMKSYETLRNIGTEHFEMVRVSGVIRHLDEVLTMSVRMCAETGDLQWEKRYREFEPALDDAIQTEKKLVPEIYESQAAADTDQANVRLVEMENAAFKKIRSGRLEEAKKIILSDVYKAQKKIYSDGISKIDQAIRWHNAQVLEKEKAKASWGLVGLMMIISTMFLTWLITLRAIRTWRRTIDEQAQALIGNNLILDRKVLERTVLLEKVNEERRVQSSALQAAANGIMISDKDGAITWINEAFTVLTGYTAGEAVGKNPRFLKSGKQSPQFYDDLWKTIFSGRVWHGEIINRRKNGSLYSEEMTITPVKGAANEISHFITIKQDITERNKNIENLKQSEERLRQITNTVPGVVYRYSIDRQGVQKFLYLSQHAEILFGLPAETLQNDFNQAWALVLPEEAEALWQSIKTATETLKPWFYEFEIKDTHGYLKWVQGNSSAEAPQTDGTIIWNGIFTDITPRKQAERKLIAQHEITRVLGEAAHLDEAVQKIIQVVCQNLDWREGAVWNVDAKAKMLRCTNIWHNATNGMKEFSDATWHMTFERGIGLPGRIWESRKPAWILDVMKDNNFPRASLAAKAGLHSAFGFPILFEDQVIGVMEFFSSEIRDPDEHLLRLMQSVGSQIGQFIRQKQLGAQLLQSQKIETVGTLAGGIAHDLNNQLTPVRGYLDLLLQQTDPGHPNHGMLAEASQAAERCAEVIQRLTRFSRTTTEKKTAILLSGMLKEFKSIIEKFLPSTIQIEFNCANDIWPIEANETEIQSVLMNLAVNARDAMPQGGRLTIEAKNIDLGGKSAGGG